MEPVWLTEARKRLGVREIPGPKHSPIIMGWIKKLGAKVLGIVVTDDETPWCGTFVASVMSDCGFKPPAIAVRASSWALWGAPLPRPTLGCVLTFNRTGGGHVGFYVGEDDTAYHVLGGNQSNAVTITRIDKSRLQTGGARWPSTAAYPKIAPVRLSVGGTPLSKNEA